MKTITGHVEGSVIVLSEALELNPSSRLEITVMPDENGKLASETKLEQMMSVQTDRLYLSESVPPSKPKEEAPAPHMEHCYAVYKFIGRGVTQEIDWLQLGAEKQSHWKREIFTDFLDDMAKQGWKLVSSTELDSDSENNHVSYFRREVEAVQMDDLSFRKDIESSILNSV